MLKNGLCPLIYLFFLFFPHFLNRFSLFSCCSPPLNKSKNLFYSSFFNLLNCLASIFIVIFFSKFKIFSLSLQNWPEISHFWSPEKARKSPKLCCRCMSDVTSLSSSPAATPSSLSGHALVALDRIDTSNTAGYIKSGVCVEKAGKLPKKTEKIEDF